MTKPGLFGTSSRGLPILSWSFGDRGPLVLILGGVHGDEPEGNYITLALLKNWLQGFPYKLRICLVPCFNVEGSLLCQRLNGNQVDLNRNLPAKSWSPHFEKERYRPGPHPASEPETQALIKWIDKKRPCLILSFHSWHPMINTNGDCRPEADILARETGYTVKDDIGYPTPGSLGDYCGHEKGIPVITYEAARGGTVEEALSLHVPAVEKALFASEKRA